MVIAVLAHDPQQMADDGIDFLLSLHAPSKRQQLGLGLGPGDRVANQGMFFLTSATTFCR